jgi:hypothetical protein
MQIQLDPQDVALISSLENGVDTTTFILPNSSMNVLKALRAELLLQKASIDSLSYINNSDTLLQAYVRHDINIQAYTYLINLSTTNRPTATSSEE